MNDIVKVHKKLGILLGIPDEVLHAVIAHQAIERINELEKALIYLYKGVWSPSSQFMENLKLKKEEQ